MVLCERPSFADFPGREESEVLDWRRLTDLARGQACRKFQHSVNKNVGVSSYSAPLSDTRGFQPIQPMSSNRMTTRMLGTTRFHVFSQFSLRLFERNDALDGAS